MNGQAYFLVAADVTSRNAEYPGTPLTDTDGDGSYNTYLGCNRAGSCAAGIGIATDNAGLLTYPAPGAMWTLLDQDGDARNPQDSQHIGGTGFVDRSSTDWPSSGGVSGKGTVPINRWDPTDQNDTFSLLVLANGWIENAVT
jgi:hypothetical protein